MLIQAWVGTGRRSQLVVQYGVGGFPAKSRIDDAPTAGKTGEKGLKAGEMSKMRRREAWLYRCLIHSQAGGGEIEWVTKSQMRSFPTKLWLQRSP